LLTLVRKKDKISRWIISGFNNQIVLNITTWNRKEKLSMSSEIEKRRQEITAFINTILSDLRSGVAFYHPSIEDIAKWYNCHYEVVWRYINSILGDNPENHRLWDQATPARGRDKVIVGFLKTECRLIEDGIIERATPDLEIATRFQTQYPDLSNQVEETKLDRHVQNLKDKVRQLVKQDLTDRQKAVRSIGLRPLGTSLPTEEKRVPTPGNQLIIDLATQLLNDYLHGRNERLPKYGEIGRLVTPHITRSRVEQILSRHLRPEAINFWMLNRCGNWRRITRMLEFASLQADRHFRDNSYHVFSIKRIARQFNLDGNTAARAIQEHLPKEQAVLWGAESEYKPESIKVHYCIRFFTKVARKHQNNPSWHLPTQGEIGQKLGIGQTGVGRIIRRWLPTELSALWAARKNHARG